MRSRSGSEGQTIAEIFRIKVRQRAAIRKCGVKRSKIFVIIILPHRGKKTIIRALGAYYVFE